MKNIVAGLLTMPSRMIESFVRMSNEAKEALFYLLAVATAEMITFLVDPIWGLIFYIPLMVVLIVRSALVRQQAYQRLFLSLSLSPLIRILDLAMPRANFPVFWRFPIVYFPIMVAAIAVVRILNLKAAEIGVRPGILTTQAGVVLLGFGLGVAEFYILKPVPLVNEFSVGAIWLPGILLFLSTGVVEEFIFRGVMQYTAGEVFGGWGGIIYVGSLFAVLHLGFRSWIDVVFVFTVAILYGWIVKRTGSLLGVTLAHGLTNFILYLIAPFLF